MILDQHSDESDSLNISLFLMVLSLYFSSLAYYGFLALKTPVRDNNEKVRFPPLAIAMTLFFSLFTAMIAVLPFESQIL